MTVIKYKLIKHVVTLYFRLIDGRTDSFIIVRKRHDLLQDIVFPWSCANWKLWQWNGCRINVSILDDDRYYDIEYRSLA